MRFLKILFSLKPANFSARATYGVLVHGLRYDEYDNHHQHRYYFDIYPSLKNKIKLASRISNQPL
jgi:hypothetical protein